MKPVKHISSKLLGCCLLMIVMNAFTQSEVKKESPPVDGVKRSLSECVTYEDSITFYKANREVNVGLARLRFKRFMNWVHRKNSTDSMMLVCPLDTILISKSKYP